MPQPRDSVFAHYSQHSSFIQQMLQSWATKPIKPVGLVSIFSSLSSNTMEEIFLFLFKTIFYTGLLDPIFVFFFPKNFAFSLKRKEQLYFMSFPPYAFLFISSVSQPIRKKLSALVDPISSSIIHETNFDVDSAPLLHQNY